MAVRLACGLSMGLLAAALSCGGPSTSKPTGSAGAGAAQSTSGAGGVSAAGKSSGGNASGGSGAGSAGAAGAAGTAEPPGFVLSDRIEQNPQTEDGACVFYNYAYCARLAYCRGSDDRNCFSSLECPDLVFSEGNSRTVENVVACAKAWTTWSCAEIGAGRDPECAVPGTLALGEPCMFHSQCGSLACAGASDGICGECSTPVAAGAACTDGDLCQGLTTCLQDQCLPSPGQRPHLGEPCEYFCAPALYCSEAGLCQAYPAIGQACGDGTQCDEYGGAYCRLSDVTCQPSPLAGQPCAEARGAGGVCDPSAECVEGQCVALGVVGESCLSEYDCARGLPCRFDVNGVGTCRQLKQRGEACVTHEDCAAMECIEGTCRLAVGPEKPCGDSGTTCLDERACENQRCAPKLLVDIFNDECR